MKPTKATLEAAIIDGLKSIYDPDIPISIYALGLIYDIDIDDNYDVQILMTLTSPNCPVAESLPLEVKELVEKIEGIHKVEVKITFDPPWNMDMLSEEAKLELGFL